MSLVAYKLSILRNFSSYTVETAQQIKYACMKMWRSEFRSPEATVIPGRLDCLWTVCSYSIGKAETTEQVGFWD